MNLSSFAALIALGGAFAVPFSLATQKVSATSVAEPSEKPSNGTVHFFDIALNAASLVKEDAFRADGLRAEVARSAMESGQLPVAGRAISQMSPSDYRIPLLLAEWILRGGKPAGDDQADLTLERAWNLGVTLAPRRRAEVVAAMRAGFPDNPKFSSDLPTEAGQKLVSGAIAAEVAGFRFACLGKLAKGELPAASDWEKALAMTKVEHFGVDPESLLLTDSLIEVGLEMLAKDPKADIKRLTEVVDATLAGSKVPSVPQGIAFAHLLLAGGQKEKAIGLLKGISGAVASISPRSPLRAVFESRLAILDVLAGERDGAKARAVAATSHLGALMDYEQFIAGGEVVAALLGAGEVDKASDCLKQLATLAAKNDNPNNLQFLRAKVAVAIARSARVTKVSQSPMAEFDTLLGYP